MVTEKEIIQASKIAFAHDFIMKLPDGYSTLISEKGTTLSGGQRQRITIARTLLNYPKILILDEPVTGLDPNQIVEIRSLIKKLGREKLVLMSSHILQEIQATVDRIIIIDKGKIGADGTSEDLISGAQGVKQLHLEIKNADNDPKVYEIKFKTKVNCQPHKATPIGINGTIVTGPKSVAK